MIKRENANPPEKNLLPSNGSDPLPYEKTGRGIRCIADEIFFEIPNS